MDQCALVHPKIGRCGENEEEQLVDGSIFKTFGCWSVLRLHGSAIALYLIGNIVKEALCRKDNISASNMLGDPVFLYSFGMSCKKST